MLRDYGRPQRKVRRNGDVGVYLAASDGSDDLDLDKVMLAVAVFRQEV